MTQWHPDEDPGWGARPDPGRDDASDETAGYLPGPGFTAPVPGDQLAGWSGAPGDGGYWPAGADARTAPWPAPPGPVSRRPGRRRPRLLLPAVTAVLVIAAAAAILTARPHALPATAAAAAQPAGSRMPASRRADPAITRTGAQQLLARYVAANNAANQARSDTQLARIEGGSSYQLDAGGYQFLSASDPGNTGYQAFSYTPAAWYIPRLASWPRWFAVYGTWAGTRSAPYRGYLVFAQARPGGLWLQVLAPGITPGMAGPAVVPATGQDGYATAVPAAAAGPSAASASLPAATAARLDGTVAAVAVTGLQSPADQRDQEYWQARVPRGTAVTDRHYPAPDVVYALAARGGGAIVFYSLAASLVVTPPPGDPVQLQIPGFYSASTPLTTAANVPYADQFAAWTGPDGARVIAQASGIAASR